MSLESIQRDMDTVRRGPKPQYPLGTVHGDSTTDRKHLSVPADLYEALLSLAGELGYHHKGRVNVLPLLDALAQVEVEVLDELLRERNLLQKPSGTDRLWW